MVELVKSQNRVNELEILTKDLPEQHIQNQDKIELNAELARAEEKLTIDFEKKINALNSKIDMYESRFKSGKNQDIV